MRFGRRQEPLPSEQPPSPVADAVDLSIAALDELKLGLDLRKWEDELTADYEALAGMARFGEFIPDLRLSYNGPTAEEFFERLQRMGIVGQVAERVWIPGHSSTGYSYDDINRIHFRPSGHIPQRSAGRIVLHNLVGGIMHNVGMPAVRLVGQGLNQSEFLLDATIYQEKAGDVNLASLSAVGISVLSVQRYLRGERAPLAPKDFLYMVPSGEIVSDDASVWHPGYGAVGVHDGRLAFGTAHDNTAVSAHGGIGITLGPNHVPVERDAA
jgi:hypothetical protein